MLVIAISRFRRDLAPGSRWSDPGISKNNHHMARRTQNGRPTDKTGRTIPHPNTHKCNNKIMALQRQCLPGTTRTCNPQLTDKTGGTIPQTNKHKCKPTITSLQRQCDPGRTRTCNLRLRRPMPYTLGHGADGQATQCQT